MNGSILDSVKNALGIMPDYTVFDMDVIMGINTAFATLQQLGVGPEEGFEVLDKTSKWDDFTGGEKLLNSVKTYIFISVKLTFDPPTTSFAIEAMDKQRKEIEWRLIVLTEEIKNG